MARRFLFVVVLVVSGLVFFAGAVFVIMYVLNGVIARIGEPDQSLLFWYLPILFMGLIGMAVGWALGAWGWKRFREVSTRGDRRR